MQISRILAVATSVMAAALLTSAPAHADLKVVQSTVIDSPQLKAMIQSMSPEQKAQMAKMGFGGTIHSTVYVQGKKVRADYGPFGTAIVNGRTHTITTLNRSAHTYSTRPYTAAQAKKAGKDIKISIKPTGKRKTILGHVCRDYHFTATDLMGPGSSATGDVWTASDLAQPPMSPLAAGPSGSLQDILGKVKGMPLQTTMTLTGTMAGSMKIDVKTKSISTAPLPASLFTVPAGYKPGPAGMGPMGGLGGMSPAGH